jgi:hypothetical protein
MKMRKKLKCGDWVEVRSKEEILRTLDGKGHLEGMPFMPEMFQFCGKRYPVYKRAHKTCDYTTRYPYRTRRLEGAVHLETRCDGEAHDGCQAGCLLIWKEAWLKRVDGPLQTAPASQLVVLPGGEGNGREENKQSSAGCSESALWNHTKVSDPKGGAPTYICQATYVPFATTYLGWWDVRQYIEDWTSGNASLRRVLTSFLYSVYYNLSQAGIGLGPVMRWIYNKLCPLWSRSKWPRTPGFIPDGSPTPAMKLNLQPGELVRVKSHEEILKTVTFSNINRGMCWDAELVPYCGGTYRVLKRVNRLIDEKTSKMVEMKTACIILDSVVCQARYSDCRMLCPKAMYPYWREIWLERVNPEGEGVSAAEEANLVTASSGPR